MSAQKIIDIMFERNPHYLQLSLWRLSRGNRQKAFEITEKYLRDHGYIVDMCDFDNACAEMNDGVEVEWLS